MSMGTGLSVGVEVAMGIAVAVAVDVYVIEAHRQRTRSRTAAKGARGAAARARVFEARAVRWTKPEGLSREEGNLPCCVSQARTLTSSSATPASCSMVRTTSTRLQICS
jgi:hypothetical protein